MPSLKDEFLLDPAVVYLNHGSYGACPRPVFADYQHWQLELERNPVAFFGLRVPPLMAEARATLAAYIGAGQDELLYFPNPTTAANMVIRSLSLQPGDEVLATDHEYGAMERTWNFHSARLGFKYLRRAIGLPVTTPEAFVNDFWGGVTERTRVIFISHITSLSALIFPIREICRRARAAGILTIVDGAHAPGQIALNLHELDPDIYIGANHKWLCAPKGSAFLYARPEAQSWLMPLVVSWGYEPNAEPSAERFVSYHEWQGTRDMAAFLATPAAVRFQVEHDWPSVRASCHALARQARQRLEALTELLPICPDSPDWYGQMAALHLPEVDCGMLSREMYERYRIILPIYFFNGWNMLRVSCQAYTTQSDIDTLLEALEALLPEAQAAFCAVPSAVA